MFWDIALAVLAASAQGLTGFLGWRVAVDVVPKWRKALYGRLFVIASVVGITAVGIAAYRMSVTARELTPHARIKLVPKENNQALPQPLSETRPLRVNYQSLNIGNDDATKASSCARVYIQDGEPDRLFVVEDVWQHFTDWCRNNKLEETGPISKGEIPFGVPYWATNDAPYFYPTSQQIDQIKHGKSHIFATVAILFDDRLGSHVQEGCWWIQAPADPESPWHECGWHHMPIDDRRSFTKQR
jgi:hypothetical protein